MMPATQKVRVMTGQMGEFIFAYPDQAQTPYVPAIRSPADTKTRSIRRRRSPLACDPAGIW